MYICEEQRHQYCCELADVALAGMTDGELVDACPDDYGTALTDEHLNYCWENVYERYQKLSDQELWLSYQLQVAKRPILSEAGSSKH